MARGWESKAVESQQEESLRPGTAGPEQSTDAHAAERSTLMLARTKMLADLQCACSGAHIAMLEHAIADLDTQIAALAPAPKT